MSESKLKSGELKTYIFNADAAPKLRHPSQCPVHGSVDVFNCRLNLSGETDKIEIIGISETCTCSSTIRIEKETDEAGT